MHSNPRHWRVFALAVSLLCALAPSVRAQGAGDAIVYYDTDAIGSVRFVSNAAGQMVERHDYLPFGQEWPGDAGVSKRKFGGKEHDGETGFDYFGARYLSAGIGRFTTVDPGQSTDANLTDPQLWNRYTYVRNNPVRYMDPDGRCIEDLCIGEGMAAIAATYAVTAYLGWPNGQRAVRGMLEGAGQLITTAAGRLSDLFSSERRPGTLGKPDHQETAADEAARISGRREVKIDTPGGKKDSRRADAIGTNPETGAPEIAQVYRPTPAGNIPKREKDAAADIERATGIKPTMVPVRPVKPPKEQKEQQ